MSEFVPNESAKVVIGVCGEQGSGKTVFLTCIFQSIWTAFPDDVNLSFERKEIGNANYFQGIEDSLIAKGPTQGTIDRSLFPARIYVKSYEPLPGSSSSVLSVDLLDFAGRHFRQMADLKHLVEAGEPDSEDIKALREVNEMLERADAFVILINSTEIDPLDPTPKRNPFSPSVNFMLSHCRENRKPVALLFSQIDQTPRLTEEMFLTLPRVKLFQRQFTQDLGESSSPGGRPFGIVRRISCYETVPGDLAPRKQTLDGSIWRPEPAEVILDLLRAAMPRIKDRLAEEEADRRRKIDEDAARVRQKGKRRWTASIAATLGILLILGILAFVWYKRTEGRQVRLLESIATGLREGRITSIMPASQAELGKILAAHRDDPGRASTVLRAAIEDLESAFGEEVERLAEEPKLDSAYGAEIARFQSLVPLFDPAVTEPWQESLLPLLASRGELLSDWFETKREGRRARTSFLDESAKRFQGTGDQAFSGILAAQSTKEKEEEVAGWQAEIDADANVTRRLATIQNLLASAVAEEDPELSRLARKALAGHLATTILKRQENGFLREKVLRPLAPTLAALEDGEVRFEVLAGDLLDCKSLGECESRRGVVQSAMSNAEEAAASWSVGVENLFRSLLLDLPLEERREVWGALADALSSAYLFSSREDAWPRGVRSLASTIRPAARAESDYTERLIQRIAQHPVYEEELLYLRDRLTAMVTRHRVVPIYSALLVGLAQSRSSSLQTGGLTAISQQVSTVLADRHGASGPLVEMGREIEQVLELVNSVNQQRFRGRLGIPSAASVAPSTRLERLLRDAKSGHCAALEAHGAPAECAA